MPYMEQMVVEGSGLKKIFRKAITLHLYRFNTFANNSTESHVLSPADKVFHQVPIQSRDKKFKRFF